MLNTILVQEYIHLIVLGISLIKQSIGPYKAAEIKDLHDKHGMNTGLGAYGNIL